MKHRFLGLVCSLGAISLSLDACNADLVVSPPVSDAGVGGNAGGGGWLTGGRGGVSASSNAGGTVGATSDASTGGTTSDASTGGMTSDASTGGTTSDAGTGGTTSDASTGGSADSGSGPSCTPPVDFTGAPVVQVSQVDTDPPAATGGAIADGLYYEAAHSLYTGPGGATGPIGSTDQRAIVISQGGTVFVESAPGSTEAGRFTFEVADGGAATSLRKQVVCPAQTVVTASYTATPTTLTIFNAGRNTQVFAKQ